MSTPELRTWFRSKPEAERREEAGALVWVVGAAAHVAIGAGWPKEAFMRLAAWCFDQESGEEVSR